MSDRIQKLLATAGIASRRAIETMIAEGRVTVNGRPAEIGQKIDHDDHVRVDGRLVALNRKPESTRVLLYRKRVGELVTREDPEGRKTVFRKLPELESGRWIAVGRLDINTSGLLLLTNDGELARRLMHPSFEMRREYAVRVLGSIDAQVLDNLKRGVELEDGFAKFETIQPGGNEDLDDEGGRRESDGSSANSWWIVTVRQGRNRVVRRLFESQNLQVSRLMRVSYGPISLGRGIKSGTAREAEPEELQALLQAVDMQSDKPQRGGKKKPSAPKSAAPAGKSASAHEGRRPLKSEFKSAPRSFDSNPKRPAKSLDRYRDDDERERSRRERFPHAESPDAAARDSRAPRFAGHKSGAGKSGAGKPRPAASPRARAFDGDEFPSDRRSDARSDRRPAAPQKSQRDAAGRGGRDERQESTSRPRAPARAASAGSGKPAGRAEFAPKPARNGNQPSRSRSATTDRPAPERASRPGGSERRSDRAPSRGSSSRPSRGADGAASGRGGKPAPRKPSRK